MDSGFRWNDSERSRWGEVYNPLKLVRITDPVAGEVFDERGEAAVV